MHALILFMLCNGLHDHMQKSRRGWVHGYVEVHMIIQMDTSGTEKQFAMQRFPLFSGCFTCIIIYLDPHKQSVIESFLICGELICYKSFHFIYMSCTR